MHQCVASASECPTLQLLAAGAIYSAGGCFEFLWTDKRDQREANVSQTTDTLEILKSYARAVGVDADLVDRVATAVSDEHSIPLRVYGNETNLTREVREVFNLHAVTVKNMKCTRSQRLVLEPGSTLLFGGNDTGKTTLLMAVLYGLFGSRVIDVAAAEDLITAGAGEMSVELEFFGGRIERGVTRRVIRKGVNAGDTKVEHYLTVEIGGDKANRAQEAQALIDGWLGADAKFVRRVMCLEQGHLTDILDAEPRVRRDTFYRMLAIDGERTRESLSKVLQQHEDFLVRKAQSKDEHQAQLESLRRRLAQYPVADLERQRATAAAQAASEQASQEVINGARAALERRIVDLATARKSDADRRELKAKIDEIKSDPIWANAVVSRDQLGLNHASAKNALVNATKTCAELEARLSVENQHGLRVKNLPSTCATCAEIGKVCELSPEAKEATLKEIRARYVATSVELSAARKRLEAAVGAEASAAAAIAECDKTESRRAFLSEQLQTLEQGLERLPVEVNTSAIAEDVEAKRQRLAEVEAQGSSAATADLQVLDKALADARALQAQIEVVERNVKELDAKQPMPRDELEALRWIVTAFAKEGMPLWLARQHIGRVNEIAKGMRDADRFHFSFDQDLAIRVESGELAIRPELASGSARERGAVVLMAAMGRYLQELSGLHIPLLWVDELPYQDAANKQLSAAIVRALTKWYPKVVFAASEWDDLLGQFDHEVGLQPEAVAAELARQREARAALAAAGQGTLEPPPPTVQTYETATQIALEQEALEHPAVGTAEQLAKHHQALEHTAEQLAEQLAEHHKTLSDRPSPGDIRYIALCIGHAMRKAWNETPVGGPCVRCARGEDPLPEDANKTRLDHASLEQAREAVGGDDSQLELVNEAHAPEW